MDLIGPKDPILENSSFAEKAKDFKYFVVADDNLGDRVLLKRAIQDNKINEGFRFVASGLELIELLEQCKPTRFYAGGGLPCLILLDLYMPRVDGHEALRVIKNDRNFRQIPIIILTSSYAQDDIVQSYHDGANSFLNKPMEYQNLVDLIGLVKKYWLQEVRLPV